MAFGLGLGFMTIIGMSSFKESKTTEANRYRLVGENWVPITLEPGTGENEYSCEGGAPEVCSVYFAATPNPGDPLPNDPNHIRYGTYVEN